MLHRHYHFSQKLNKILRTLYSDEHDLEDEEEDDDDDEDEDEAEVTIRGGDLNFQTARERQRERERSSKRLFKLNYRWIRLRLVCFNHFQRRKGQYA